MFSIYFLIYWFLWILLIISRVEGHRFWNGHYQWRNSREILLIKSRDTSTQEMRHESLHLWFSFYVSLSLYKWHHILSNPREEEPLKTVNKILVYLSGFLLACYSLPPASGFLTFLLFSCLSRIYWNCISLFLMWLNPIILFLFSI